jgi:hypothetical protein
LLSAGFQQIPVTSAVTSTNSIVAYGAEAQIFVSLLSLELSGLNLVLDSQSRVIMVISDISLVDLQSISDSMENGAILVAINLPEDNGLVDAPMDTFSSSRIINGRRVTETWQDVVSPYWIVVTKQETPSFTGRYCGGTAEDEQSHQDVMQMALDGVYEALFPYVEYPFRSEVVADGDHEGIDSAVGVM